MSVPPRCLACCPVCCPPAVVQKVAKPPTPPPLLPPDVMVCIKVGNVEKKRTNRTSKKDCNPKRTKRAKSRELRGSILYTGCNCEKRDGLQDDCPRTGCHGSSECLTKPNPICGPSEFSNGKHLGKKFDKDLKNKVAEDDKPDTVAFNYNCFPAVIVS